MRSVCCCCSVQLCVWWINERVGTWGGCPVGRGQKLRTCECVSGPLLSLARLAVRLSCGPVGAYYDLSISYATVCASVKVVVVGATGNKVGSELSKGSCRSDPFNV